MLSITFFVLIISKLPTIQSLTGPNGQICAISSDNACPSFGTSFTPLIGTEIECEEDFECCMCQSITCGTSSFGQSCEKFAAKGDSSAFYVYPINIFGDISDGTDIECEGDRSCEGTMLTGTYIKDIKCGGYRACADTEWNIDCHVKDGCEIECDGHQSCAGTAANHAMFTITNSKGLKCGEKNSCQKAVFTLDSNQKDSKIECEEEFACYDSIFTVSNIETFECGDDFSCGNSVVTITNPSKDFEFKCEGMGSCQATTVVIRLTETSTVSKLKGIKCSDELSCKGAEFTIINESPMTVVIEDLDCEGTYSCQEAVFTLVETTNPIIFQDCECSTTGCIGTIQGGTGTPIGCFPFGTPSPTSPSPTNMITTAIPTMIGTVTTDDDTPSPISTPSPVMTPSPITPVITPSPTLFGTILGANGQDCTPGNDDNLPDACPIINGEFTSLFGSEIECEENFDCCTCKSIICGSLIGERCENFKANGDSSAFYVYPILIIGDSEDGVDIDCNGDNSCEGSRINGTFIENVKCSGDMSCRNAQWNLECLIDDGCTVECDGDLSCQGLSKHSKSLFRIANSAGLKCANAACSNAKFFLNSNIGEGKVECDGEMSCMNSLIEINNIETLSCAGDYSCYNSTIIVTDPMNEFEIECEGTNACEYLNLKVIIPITSTIEEIESIKCGSANACKDAVITIINERSLALIIDELDCEATNACLRTEFNLIGNIGFNECKCGDNAGCLGTEGLESCFANLDKLECKDVSSCAGMSVTIVNPEEDFELICDDIASCHNFNLTIIINNNAKDFPIEEIKGVKCAKSISCLGLKYTIDNQQTGIVTKVEKIECEEERSCESALFSGNANNNVIFEEINCEESNACGIYGTVNQCTAESGGVQVYCGSSIFN